MTVYVPILPTALLRSATIASRQWHFALANQCAVDIEYARAYQALSKAGKNIILDNGAYEAGHSADDDSLMNWARAIGPTELVLPDVLYGNLATVLRTLTFWNKYGAEVLELGIRPMIVPQGQTIKEWFDCLEALYVCVANSSEYLSKFTIGVPKHVTRWYPGARIALANALHVWLTNHRLLQYVEVHFLGADDYLREPSMIPNAPHIRSFDSDKAAVFAWPGIETSLRRERLPLLDIYGRPIHHTRPKNFFGAKMVPGQTSRTLHNVSAVDYWMEHGVHDYELKGIVAREQPVPSVRAV